MDSHTQTVNKIRQLDRQFRRACQQVELLDSRILDLKQRHKRACRDQRRGFRSVSRLRMASYQGVRDMMYTYAEKKCEEIAELHRQLVADYMAAKGETEASSQEQED